MQSNGFQFILDSTQPRRVFGRPFLHPIIPFLFVWVIPSSNATSHHRYSCSSVVAWEAKLKSVNHYRLAPIVVRYGGYSTVPISFQGTYSRVPNNRACSNHLFLVKNHPGRGLLGTAQLIFFVFFE